MTNKNKLIAFGCAVFISVGLIFVVYFFRFHGRSRIDVTERELVTAKIALVIDDFGYNDRNVEGFLALDTPITFSVLPNLPYSMSICARVAKNGHEAILHLPLEPGEQNRLIRPEAVTIYTYMTDEEIIEKLTNAMQSTPGIVGVSNHQGSKATEDKRLMAIIFKQLKKDKLFFLDSLVTNKSVCEYLAKEMQVEFIKRDVFLDNKPVPEYIQGQMQQLVSWARRSGSAVGIAHDRKSTLNVLAECIPRLKEDGIKFVFLSEVVNQEHDNNWH